MPVDQNALNRIMGAARARNVAQVEELWVDLLHLGEIPENLRTLIKIVEEVARRGDPEYASELLVHPLLRSGLREAEKHDELFEVLQRAVALSPRVKGIREDLLDQYRRRYADREGLEAVISKTDLGGEGRLREAVRQLDEAFFFQVGDHVFHERGWGVGRVVEAHPETGELVIDFHERKGQRMEAGMALKSLQKRPADDLDVLLWTDTDQLKELSTSDPLTLLRKALASYDGKLQSKTLRDKLVPVLGKSAWTKFWAKARKLAKDDPQIDIGSGARATIALRDEPLSREDEVAQQIRRLRSFKDRLKIARRELLAVRKSPGEEPPKWMEGALKALGTNHGKGAEQRAARFELALFQTEVAEAWPATYPDVQQIDEGEPEMDPDTGEPMARELPELLATALRPLNGLDMPPILKEISTPDYRKRAVRLVATYGGEDAVETLREVVLDPAAQSWDEAVRSLNEIGRDDVIIEAVNQILITPREHPQALAAFARARFSKSLDMLPDRSNAEILIKALKVFDSVNLAFKNSGNRKEKATLKPAVEALRTTISEKSQRAIKDVIGEGSEGDVRRVLQIVRQSPTLTGTVKRAAEKAVAKRFPELLATVATNLREEDADDGTLYSTGEGVRRREDLLKEIRNVRMEAVRLEIGRALEFGDISENAELDAARERQQRLAEQATRIQEELGRVTLINLDTVTTDEVVVGTCVSVHVAETDETETYKILGPWDLDEADSSIISHLSAVGKGLIGSKVGDEVKISLPGNRSQTYKVLSIERAQLQTS